MKDITIKKPQQARSKAKFEAILLACPRVFATAGYSKTTTAAIALEADVSIGSLYDYFSCKEAVLIAYLDFELDSALQQVALQARESQQDFDSTLTALIRSGIHFAEQQRPILKIAFTQFPTMINRLDLTRSREKIAQIAADFANSKQIDIQDRDINLMIYSLTNIVMGFQFRIALVDDQSFDTETLVKELQYIVKAYIQPSQKSMPAEARE